MHACKHTSGVAAAHDLQVTKRGVSGSCAPRNLRDRDDIRRVRSPGLSLSLSYLCARAISPFRAHEFNPRGMSGASQTSWVQPLNLGPCSTIIDARDRDKPVGSSRSKRDTGCVPARQGVLTLLWDSRYTASVSNRTNFCFGGIKKFEKKKKHLQLSSAYFSAKKQLIFLSTTPFLPSFFLSFARLFCNLCLWRIA